MPKEEKGYWFSTENGTHIHAEEGESKESAMKKKFSNFGKKEEQKPSLKERRKEWEKNLSKSGDEYQKRTGELYQKLRNGEISRKQYNQEFKKIQEDYQKANAFPQRDRLAVDDEIEEYEKQFKSIKEQLDPLEEEDSRAFNRSLMFNEPYDESKKNPKIAELNTQLKDVMDKRTDARRRLAKELGSQFGRKDYREEIDSGNLPSGNDRVYAMYQKSLEEPYLDFSRMIANDVSENVKQYPKKLEFEDDLYEISESGRAFDHYKKENGEWQHISTGTISALGKDLGRKLEEENLKSTEAKSGKVEPSKLAKKIKTVDDVKSVFGKYLNEKDIKKLDNSKNLYIEISKQYDGDDNFQIIDDERIKKGHNYGKGTLKDFQEYMKNNKDYAHFIKLR